MKITVIIEAKQNPDGDPADAMAHYMRAKNALSGALSQLREDPNVFTCATIEPQRFRGDKVDWSLGE